MSLVTPGGFVHKCGACGGTWIRTHECEGAVAGCGWLIELDPGQYLGRGLDLAFDWVPPVRALRYARREDAEVARESIAQVYSAWDLACTWPPGFGRPRDFAARLRAAKVVDHAWEAPEQ